MNRLTVAKHIVKKLGIRLPVILDVDFYVEEEDSLPIRIAVQDPDFTLTDINDMKVELAQKQYTKDLCDKHNIPCNYTLFALLHEVGHIKTAIFDPENEEYETDCATLHQLFIKNMLSHEDYIRLYNNIDAERLANDWAVSFIKENPSVYANFERIWV